MIQCQMLWAGRADMEVEEPHLYSHSEGKREVTIRELSFGRSPPVAYSLTEKRWISQLH